MSLPLRINEEFYDVKWKQNLDNAGVKKDLNISEWKITHQI